MGDARKHCREGHDWRNPSWWRRIFACSECTMEMMFDFNDTYESALLNHALHTSYQGTAPPASPTAEEER